jgi:outer membrane protein, multidrug efflux system
MRRSFVLLAGIALGAAGCAVGPSYERPDLAPPPAWNQQPAVAESSLANLPWWDLFQDEALQGLLRTALAENKDRKIAMARIDEARAALGFSHASQLPTVDYTGSASRGKASEKLNPLAAGATTNEFALGGTLFYEADLWGKYRRSTEAAQADLLATDFAYRNVTIQLVANVANTYFLLRDLDARLEIARQTLESRRGSLQLVRLKFEGGIVPELDVHQAEIQETIAAATVPDLERQVVQTENALSILLGHPPGPIARGPALTEQALPPEVPAGLPAALLERRPDVLAAEEAVHAQTARIGVAQAARLPSIALTASGGVASTELEEFFTQAPSYWSIAAQLAGPLLDFGKRKSVVQVERARTEQALQAYEQAVLQAFREVEDALVAVRTSQERYLALHRQVVAATGALTLSLARYDGGVTSYLEVLDSERSLFDSRLQESEAQQARVSSVVQLYKALGGGWETAAAADSAAASESPRH